jgi:hypothetical protein
MGHKLGTGRISSRCLQGQSLVETGLVERRAGSGTFAKSGGVKEHTAPAARVLALLVPDLRIGGEIAGWRECTTTV